jgi:hypothetical protein
MRGKTDFEINKERQGIVHHLLQKYGPVHILDTVFTSYDPNLNKPLHYLGESIKALAEADVAVFAPGWDQARGCRIERACCAEYGVQVLDLAEGEDNAEA